MRRPSAIWKFDGTSYTNLTQSNYQGTVFDFIATTDDIFYIGFTSRIIGMVIGITTIGCYSGLSFKQWEGDDWVEVVPIETYDFSSAGVFTFDVNTKTDIRSFTSTAPHDDNGGIEPPDSVSRYWLRVSASGVTTKAVISSVDIIPYVLYATPSDVADYLSFKTSFDAETIPTAFMVEDMLKRAEGVIDRKTLRSWRLNYAEEEFQEFNINGIKLLHYPIRDVYSAEIWDGGAFEALTFGRQHDYFVNKSIGMLYFSRYFMLPARFAYPIPGWRWGFGEFTYPIKIKYTWGEDSRRSKEFPMVQDIALKMVAIDLVQTSDYTSLFASGVDRVALTEKARNWREEINNDLEDLKRLFVF